MVVSSNTFRKGVEMTLSQLNELINRGGIALGLTLIAAILLFVLLRKDMGRSKKK